MEVYERKLREGILKCKAEITVNCYFAATFAMPADSKIYLHLNRGTNKIKM